MELRDYFKIIGRHFYVFFVIVILATLSAYFFTKTKSTTYSASTTFTVNKSSLIKQQQVSYYLYDNFYNVQSANLFSQIVSSWFSSPSLVQEIYQKAGVDSSGMSQKQLSKAFKSVSQESSAIDVSISEKDKGKADRLINAAADVLQEKADELGKNQESFYRIEKFTPIVTKNVPNVLLNTLIGFVSGIVIGVMTTFAIAYFKRERV